MLPSFPKSQRASNDEWNKHMFAAKNRVFPLQIHPPVLQIIEGKKSDFQREDRKVEPLKMKRHQVTVRHSIKDGKGMSLLAFYEKAREAGEGMGKNMWETQFNAINEAVKETGNQLKFRKGHLAQKNILQLLEMGQQNFDEHGNPTGQLVAGSEFLEELRRREKEWSQDTEFLAKVEEIKIRKMQEFNE